MTRFVIRNPRMQDNRLCVSSSTGVHIGVSIGTNEAVTGNGFQELPSFQGIILQQRRGWPFLPNQEDSLPAIRGKG